MVPAVTPPVTVPVVKLTDDELLCSSKNKLSLYFWDYAESNSGMARERYIPQDPSFDQNIVTSGGSGFGLMAIVSGMSLWLYFKNTRSRPFEQNCYLSDTAAFSRCMATINGTTGRVIPFGTKDNGDLVETSFLVAGMITVPRIL
jgi:hypothetical protein